MGDLAGLLRGHGAKAGGGGWCAGEVRHAVFIAVSTVGNRRGIVCVILREFILKCVMWIAKSWICLFAVEWSGDEARGSRGGGTLGRDA